MVKVSLYCVLELVDFMLHSSECFALYPLAFSFLCILHHAYFKLYQHVHFIRYSNSCFYHTVFVSSLISYCIRPHVHFVLYSSAHLAYSFQTIFANLFISYWIRAKSVSMFIFHRVRQHVIFILHSSACTFYAVFTRIFGIFIHTVFVSILISYCIRQHVHFMLYSP